MIRFPLSVVMAAVDQWTAPLAKMQGKINQTFAPLRELGTKVHLLGEASGVRRLGAAFAGVGTAVADLGRRVAGVAAGIVAGISAAAAALYGIALSTARAGNNAAKAAQKIGISVQAYQELAYAAELADVEQGTLDKGLQLLVRTMGQAALGSRSASLGFRRLGVQIRDSRGQLRPVGEVLGEIADRSKELSDPLKRNAILAQIFGRSAAELVPLLAEGSEGLAAYAAEARALGVVLDRDGIRASEEFMDAQDRVKAAIQGVRNTIGVALLPVLIDLLGRFRDLAVRYQPQIREWATRFAEKLPERLERISRLLSELVEDLRPVVRWIDRLVERFGAAKVGAVALGTALSVILVPAVLSTIASLVTLSTALVSTPAGWVVIFLVACAAAGAAFALILVKIAQNWRSLWDLLLTNLIVLRSAIAAWAAGVAESIVAPFRAAFDWISDRLSSLGSVLPDWLRERIGLSISSTAAGAPAAAGDLAQAAGAATAAPGGTASVRVEFENAPRGLRATSDSSGGVDVDLSLGYSLTGG